MSHKQNVPTIALGESTIRCGDVDEALVRTIESVFDFGHEVSTYRGGEVQSAKQSTEILAFTVSVDNPRARVLANPARRLNVTGAVARFVWMVAASDRLEDIAFYEPKVRPYTDNQVSVPGSNYGMRIFQPRPGLNQIEGVIRRLGEEVGSRRAAAVVWSPEDATRESGDIPCAFGTFYHVRNDRLVTTTVMRSNNGVLLLPYNAFEFGLIGELVARAVGVELGPYVHFAASMHIYQDQQWEIAQEIKRAYSEGKVQSAVMPPMPQDPDPLHQANQLARLEAKLRHSHNELSSATVQDLIREAADGLGEYWMGFYNVLLAHALTKTKQFEVAEEVADSLPDYFRLSVAEAVRSAKKKEEQPGVSTQEQFDLGFGRAREVPLTTDLSLIRNAYAPDLDEVHAQIDRLDRVCDKIGERSGRPVTRSEFQLLRQRLLQERLPAAARSEGSTADASAYLQLSLEEVERELEAIRKES